MEHMLTTIFRAYLGVCSALTLAFIVWLTSKTTTNSETLVAVSSELPHLRETMNIQDRRMTKIETDYATKTQLENQKLTQELAQAKFELEILNATGKPQTRR